MVEGCGDFACEYMSDGIYINIGRPGNNFGRNMIGGVAV